ncbi:RHTO0S04e03554g2_1 [Rhodotorula toruloides]|uniref:RHTO0S04e03554g2_1 n=1 Tax=Rhodotorula toruloides TaxID=5286 RepID=A0A061AQ47_RHOTO|nr:RHTO0S04e03554g2_1 [Rhodotorula toruloides]
MLRRRLLSSTPLSRPRPTFIRNSSQTTHTRTMASSSLPKVKPYSQGQAKIRNSEPMKEGKWIGLEKIDWTDEDGKDRVWEMAVRKTTSEGGIDAVAIAALLRHPSKPVSLPIILQYRPPIRNICVELPAGLIDKGESPEKSAIRELYEETGYGGKEFEGRIEVLEVGSTIVSDPVRKPLANQPGMSKANMSLVTLQVELKEGEEEPTPHLDEGEHIDVRVVPVAELYSHLQAFEELGYTVDARLHHYAAGIEAAKKLFGQGSERL